ncbi:hypothetical protein BKA70DRAFT_1475115 [Coprinopsis sp. MPI-PUGE-AT-0042]|nr:hypothetical protein BKA70DRAFT_1475115 [Coprinopsis sp. MPI-PUGE-AT-0042]
MAAGTERYVHYAKRRLRNHSHSLVASHSHAKGYRKEGLEQQAKKAKRQYDPTATTTPNSLPTNGGSSGVTVKRPQNQFFLFKSWMMEEAKAKGLMAGVFARLPPRSQSTAGGRFDSTSQKTCVMSLLANGGAQGLLKIAGLWWRETLFQRDEMNGTKGKEEESKRHAAKNPEYKFQPKAKSKNQVAKNSKTRNRGARKAAAKSRQETGTTAPSVDSINAGHGSGPRATHGPRGPYNDLTIPPITSNPSLHSPPDWRTCPPSIATHKLRSWKQHTRLQSNVIQSQGIFERQGSQMPGGSEGLHGSGSHMIVPSNMAQMFGPSFQASFVDLDSIQQNQIPGRSRGNGFHDSNYAQPQPTFEPMQMAAYEVPTAATQCMQNEAGDDANGLSWWSDQIGNLSTTSPFNTSNPPTSANVEQGQSSASHEGLTHYSQQESLASSNTTEINVSAPPISNDDGSGNDFLAYSAAGMSAFAMEFDPATFSLPDFMHNEPEAFEGSAEIYSQYENNNMASYASQWDQNYGF